MKKPILAKNRRIIQKNAQKRAKRELIGRKKTCLIRASREGGTQKKQVKRTRKRRSNTSTLQRIELPAQLDLELNFAKIMTIINEIKANVEFSLIFDDVKSVSPAAALMIAAELHVHQLRSPHDAHMFAGGSAQDSDAIKHLKDMGFMALLNVDSHRQSTRDFQPEVFVKFMSHEAHHALDDGRGIMKIMEAMNRLLKDNKITSTLRHVIYAGISEAIINTHNHAYKGEKIQQKTSRWWISASVNNETGEIKLVCYDRGWSIPTTIRKSKKTMKQIGMFFGDKDEDIIFKAIESRETSTADKATRGHGLLELKSGIRVNQQGTLTVYSGNGKVTYNTPKNGKESQHRDPLSPKLEGTLVEWSIIIPTTRT